MMSRWEVIIKFIQIMYIYLFDLIIYSIYLFIYLFVYLFIDLFIYEYLFVV
jgi:hypothetical protein